MLNFKEWANFGFKDKDKKREKPEYDGPNNPINAEQIIAELIRLPDIGIDSPNHVWQDVIEWGKFPGSLMIDVSPLGSYKIIIRQKAINLIGENEWVCVDVVNLNENNHNDDEIKIAHEVHDKLNKHFKKQPVCTANEYKDFNKLVATIYETCRKKHPEVMFPTGFKKINDNYFKLVFEFRGGGVEAPARSRAEQFDIDILWEKEKGLIRCWGYDIDSEVKAHTWKVQPSEWDEYFSPLQPIKEITTIINKMFMTY